MGDSNGRFVWYEVMSTDTKASKAFYTEVMGWTTKPSPGGDEYTMFCVGDRMVAGLMLLPEEASKMGAPPHWIAYTGVDDVAAAANRAVELGGKILKGATDIPGMGCFAVLADPQGAVFAVFASKNTDDASDDAPVLGGFSWHELNTTNYESAWTFYSELFDWKSTEAMDMGPEAGTYFMFQRQGAEGSMGGMSNAATMMKFPPHWLYYTSVDDIDATIRRIEANGGKVLNGPMEVPGGDKVAQCQDPLGIAFAIHCRSE